MTVLPFVLGVVGLSIAGALRGGSPKKKLAMRGRHFEEGVLLEIRVPRGNEKDPLAAEQMFASLHGLLRVDPHEQEHISFEIASDASGIHFYAWCPQHLQEFVAGQIYAQYPSAEIKPVEHDYMNTDLSGLSVCGATLKLPKESFFPLKTFRDFEVDPLASVTGSMGEVGEGERIWLQILVRPVPDGWQETGHAYVEEVKTGVAKAKLGVSEFVRGVVEEIGSLIPHAFEQFVNPERQAEKIAKAGGPSRIEYPRLSAGQELELKMIEDKLTRMGFEVAIRVLTAALDEENCNKLLRGVTASFRQFSSANLNSFVGTAPGGRIGDFKKTVTTRTFPEEKPYILDTAELASVFHLPNVSVETPAISWATYKKGEPPANLPTSNCTYFAQTTFRERLVRFGIKRDDRRKHMYLVGKTGTGKSTLFKNMIVQDIQNGEGVAVLDPHGDLVKDLLDFIPPERVKDVVYFDPADVERPVGLNLLELNDTSQKNLLASGLLDAFKKHFIDISWGPRLEYLLNNAILTLLEVPGTTLLGITRLLSDKNYQKYIVHKVKDPVLRDFWETEYKQMMGNPRLHTEAVAPIQNKVGRFLASSTIRNIVGQRTSSLDLDDIMNSGKILLVNLSKGKIGEDNANLLGSLLISRINFTAMQRVRLPEDERRDFYVYADEFQNFASGSFASILSEARKYRLSLHLTHQYVEQIPENMQDAIFGNVGTILVFAVGAPDAAVLEKEFVPYFTAEDLISLDKFHMYVKLMADGMISKPFSAVSFPPPEGRTYQSQEAVEFSRTSYGRNAKEIEGKIRRWSEREFTKGLAIAEEKRQDVIEPGEAGGEVK
ncbi:type IV secretion system DNA-binding domain-containing protein [Candidatus Saccharibacteria bacterium]|nr:type IV secretion system DNA-binding domain-containing protein [Candidatus Saccharibacteria bacterium]